MSYQYLTVKSLGDAVIMVTINRPEKRNALSLALMEELSTVFEGFQKHSPYRIVILHGAGSVFCSGLDLNEAFDVSLAEKMVQHVARLLKDIYTSPLVTIAAVQGDAVAGGAGLVEACDYALLARGARMGFPETRRGLVAAQVATLLCRQISMRNVRELLLLGELVDSERALKMGLVNRVVEEEDLLPEAFRVAELVLQGAPEATKDTKHLLDRLDPASFFKDLETALSFYQSARHSLESAEGIEAFLEKRLPKWSKKINETV